MKGGVFALGKLDWMSGDRGRVPKKSYLVETNNLILNTIATRQQKWPIRKPSQNEW